MNDKNQTPPVHAPVLSIRRLSGDDAKACVGALSDLLIDCVKGGASVGFMLPLARGRALQFWRLVADSVGHGERVLLVAESAASEGKPQLVGTVQLLLSTPENQPHRADVAKMLVHRSARRRGVAAALLQAVDAEAQAEGRTVLVLDTVTSGDAERLYARHGWQPVGSVPRYALMPNGGFCATTFFHKQL